MRKISLLVYPDTESCIYRPLSYPYKEAKKDGAKMESVKQNTVNYCLYARKSTEDDERQTMSIDSQIKEMTDLAIRDNLYIKEVRTEKHWDDVQSLHN